MAKFIQKIHIVFADLEGKNLATKHAPEKIDRVLHLILVDVFNKYLDNYVKTSKISDYLNPFKDTKTITLTDGLGDLPPDYAHYRNVYLPDNLTPVAIIDDKFWPARSRRVLGGPSPTRPIARLEKVEGGTMKIQVVPVGIPSIKMLYFRYPKEPKYAYTLVNNRYVYDDDNSTDVEFPTGLYMDIMNRLLSAFSIVLREGQLTQIAEQLKSQEQLK